MRGLFYLAVAAAVIAVVFWGFDRVRRPTPRRLPAAPVPVEKHVEERASLISGGAAGGPGVLRASTTQLVFTADSGRVLVLERIDINGVGVTHELPDRTVAQAVLAVSTRDQNYYFAVADPTVWERRLL